MRLSMEARFWAKVDSNGPTPKHCPELGNCWVWRAQLQPAFRGNGGYAKFNSGGGQLAHRFSYELFHGRIPEGMIVLHRCDNRACVRPDHLRVGTTLDNSGDKLQKMRMARKLGHQELSDIRQLLAAGDMPQKSIAERYCVSNATISLIKSGQRWSWLDTDRG